MINMGVPEVNLLKYIIVSLGLGMLSESVREALEKLRRAYSPRKHGKVLVGSRKNRIMRTVSVGAAPAVLLCSIFLSAIIIIGEGGF